MEGTELSWRRNIQKGRIKDYITKWKRNQIFDEKAGIYNISKIYKKYKKINIFIFLEYVRFTIVFKKSEDAEENM